ncbi:DUF6445 family protein [Blastomonas sp.]|uniref:DUF6445 family protein n=1 Tax=Blastomonas sp. TaxID=1909299 RepID=UPI0035938119
MLPTMLIIDDFLADPYAARAAALALDYDPASRKGNYPGTMSGAPLVIEGLETAVSRAVGVPMIPQPGTTHGHCRLTLKGDRGVSGVHIDPCFYSGILFLSRDADARGGTDFFRHKRTGLDRVPTDPLALVQAGFADANALVDEVVNRDTQHAGRWERTMRVPMRFNRLILFSPWLFHNAADGFGADAETGRLVHLQFFARG